MKRKAEHLNDDAPKSKETTLGPGPDSPVCEAVQLKSSTPTNTSAVLEPTTVPTEGSIYSSKATLLLVGFPGAGKRTLGVIASVTLRRRYVDFGSLFERRIGLSPIAYMATHGIEALREAEAKLTELLLRSCNEGCVIAGLTDFGGKAQLELLKSFSRSHPVIYIQRDAADLYRSFSENRSQEQIHSVRDGFYRSCSNFDFFNITQPLESPNKTNAAGTLTLKQTEIDFVRFVNRIFGRIPKLLHSTEPFSPAYTYALQVPFQWVEKHATEYDQLECGADVTSLVVDPWPILSDHFSERISKQMAILRRHTRAPIMIEVSFSPERDPGDYFKLLRVCLRCAPDYLAICLRANRNQLNAFSSARGHTRLVGTEHHSLKEDGELDVLRWTAIHNLALQLGCHAVRLTRDGDSTFENFESINDSARTRNSWTIPLIAYNTGPLGRTSLCFNPILSPVVLPNMGQDGVTVRQAQSALYSGFILSKKKFTILGQSVSYSLSPAMHNAAYVANGLPHRYGVLQSNDFGSIHRLLADEQCGGVTVSLPFKMKVLPILNTISIQARDIGAVNTVVVERRTVDGSGTQSVLHGHNTDHIGIRECIERNISPANSVRDSSTALVIGAGGMARAAIYSCITLGIKHVCMYNRTQAHAVSLVDHYTQQDVDLHVLSTLETQWPEHLRQPNVIVSCIPAHSISGQGAHELAIPDHWLQSRTGGVFIELAYKPLITRLIKQMRLKATSGWIVVDGLEVLVEQGIAQFELFTGRPAPVNVMRKAVRKQYELILESDQQ